MRRGDSTVDASTRETVDHAEVPRALGLTVLHYGDAALLGTTIPLGEDDVVIGRRPERAQDIELKTDERSSRQHTRVERTKTGHKAVDLKSKNGTFVDGRRIDDAALTVGSILRVGDTLFEYGPMPPPPSTASITGNMLGSAYETAQLFLAIDRVAAGDVPVLILGEAGTGKELIAERLHARSKRSGAFVAFNCAAVPRELFESHLFGHQKGAFTGATADLEGAVGKAEGGTLFLDEVGEMPLELQPKLLRVLATHEYSNVGSLQTKNANLRIVAATNVDLPALSQRGAFRSDLFARLSGWIVEAPPLRARKSDILQLAKHFYVQAAPDRTLVLTADLAEKLLTYAWPMNIRELRTVMRRLALVEDDAQAQMIEKAMKGAVVKEAQGIPEPPTSKEQLAAALRDHGGSVARVAEHYGRDRKQVYRWLEKFGLSLEDFRVDE